MTTDYDRGRLDAFNEVFTSRTSVPKSDFPVTICSVPGSAWDVLAKDRDEWKKKACEAENLSANRYKDLKDLQATMLEARHVLKRLIWFLGCKDEHDIGAPGDILSDVECLRQLLQPVPPNSNGSDG